jgi:hypothetical protein
LPESVKSSRSSAQIYFRIFDAFNYHYGVAYGGTVFLMELIGKGEFLDFTKAANPDANHLLVIAKGSEFAFYVNGKPLYYLNNPSIYREGNILLGCGSGQRDLNNPAICAFDNIKIWNIRDISIP